MGEKFGSQKSYAYLRLLFPRHEQDLTAGERCGALQFIAAAITAGVFNQLPSEESPAKREASMVDTTMKEDDISKNKLVKEHVAKLASRYNKLRKKIAKAERRLLMSQPDSKVDMALAVNNRRYREAAIKHILDDVESA